MTQKVSRVQLVKRAHCDDQGDTYLGYFKTLMSAESALDGQRVVTEEI